MKLTYFGGLGDVYVPGGLSFVRYHLCWSLCSFAGVTYFRWSFCTLVDCVELMYLVVEFIILYLGGFSEF